MFMIEVQTLQGDKTELVCEGLSSDLFFVCVMLQENTRVKAYKVYGKHGGYVPSDFNFNGLVLPKWLHEEEKFQY